MGIHLIVSSLMVNDGICKAQANLHGSGMWTCQKYFSIKVSWNENKIFLNTGVLPADEIKLTLNPRPWTASKNVEHQSFYIFNISDHATLPHDCKYKISTFTKLQDEKGFHLWILLQSLNPTK